MFNKDVYSGRRATLKKMISKGIAAISPISLG